MQKTISTILTFYVKVYHKLFPSEAHNNGEMHLHGPLLSWHLGLSGGVLEKSKNIEIGEKLMKDLFQQYDYFVMPPNSIPIPVRIGLYVTGLSHISELDMEFTLTYYFRSVWMDDRLQFNPQKYGNISEIVLHPKRIEQIWKPGIFFRNERGRSISEDSSFSYFFCKVPFQWSCVPLQKARDNISLRNGLTKISI